MRPSQFRAKLKFEFKLEIGRAIENRKSVDFADKICEVTKDFIRGNYYLADQLNRAALSISTNIAEGNGRYHKADRINFFRIARGSAFECVPILEICTRKGLINTDKSIEVNGKPLLSLPLKCSNMGDNSTNSDLSEHVCLVEWLRCLPREEAKWRKSPKLFTTELVRASLDGQQETIAFIEKQFGISIKEEIA